MAVKDILQLRGKNILIITHKGADVDAIASAAVLRATLIKNNNVEIAVPEHVNRKAKEIAENLDIPYSMMPDFSLFHALVFVDLNSYEMLGRFEEEVKGSKCQKFLFDHHTKSQDAITTKENSLIIEDAASTTEVLSYFLKDEKEEISEEQALLIALGIISDTDRFSFASKDTFGIIADMLKISKKDFNEILSMVSEQRSLSEKIAILKAMQKTEIIKIGDIIIAKGWIGSFEAQAAEALISCGADVAFVGGVTDGHARISGRADFLFAKNYGLDLANEIFQKLTLFFEGRGGGHATAASFTGKAQDLERIMQKCLDLISERLEA
ncbi:MAG: DHH family phosphoesterase [Candidatus Diapherotrites archaeon]|nr:DHH family phosphoesterase [Candidatus Diapherotrites archaeon]